MIEAKGYCCTMLEVIGNHCIRGQGLLHGGRDERQQLHEQDPGFFKTAATCRNMVSPPTISDHRLVKTTISELISWKIPYPPLQSASAACIN